jgi:hypothetical protein
MESSEWLVIGVAVVVVIGTALYWRRTSVRQPIADGEEAAGDDMFPPRKLEVVTQTASEIAAVFQQAFLKTSRSGVVIVTPERNLVAFMGGVPDHLPEANQLSTELFGAARDLKIIVISFTESDALRADTTYLKCIPFLGILIALGSVGHRVVVFEGHPSALQIAVTDANVLLVDDGMVPFLQPDWLSAARNALKPGGRVLVHRRSDYKLTEAVARRELGESAAPTEP